MKATGIVRRIDDLGRVVIPKEIRRTMRIREGDPLEIFTDKDGELIFKKYSPIGEISDFAAQICDSLKKSTEGIAAVCDRDSVIAIAGGAKRELMGRSISAKLSEIMDARSAYRHSVGGSSIAVSPEDDKYCVDILTQTAAVSSAIGSFSREILEAHIRSCVIDGVKSGDNEKIEELISVIERFMK